MKILLFIQNIRMNGIAQVNPPITMTSTIPDTKFATSLLLCFSKTIFTIWGVVLITAERMRTRVAARYSRLHEPIIGVLNASQIAVYLSMFIATTKLTERLSAIIKYQLNIVKHNLRKCGTSFNHYRVSLKGIGMIRFITKGVQGVICFKTCRCGASKCWNSRD